MNEVGIILEMSTFKWHLLVMARPLPKGMEHNGGWHLRQRPCGHEGEGRRCSGCSGYCLKDPLIILRWVGA